MKNKTNLSLTKIALALHLLLTPFILGGIAYAVINSNFEGLIHMKLGKDGGEIRIERPTAERKKVWGNK
ncbi:MAG: hypothetical protein F6K14_24790 [Symploca sp. SIO2C1]|nr:hypothetical protein [Symploca sp. SIO2C1]